MEIGDKIKVFPDTDIDAYINYFDSIGFTSKHEKNYIIITGYKPGRRRKDFDKLSEVGNRIKKIRKQMYFSIEELADEIGTTTITIQAWEDGRTIPKGPALNRFLEFAGATREYIFDGKGQWVDEVKEIMKELEREG